MSQQWLPEDTPPEDDIKNWVEKLFECLNKLEEVVDAEYEQNRNKANLVLQIQAVHSARNTLNKAFPYTDDTDTEQKSAGYPIGSTLPDDEGKVKVSVPESFSAENVLPDDSEDKSADEVETDKDE